MSDLWTIVIVLQVAALIVALALAAAWDATTREVPDRLWQLAGILGAALGAVLLVGDGPGAVGLWLLVAGFALQHLFPWDRKWEGEGSPVPEAVEIALYLLVGAVLIVAAWIYGFGAGGVPIVAVALYIVTVVTRLLFETRILYGGADAKALITIGVLLPIWATPILGQPATLAPLAAVTPFALTALIDGAILTLAVPVALGVLNVRRGEFSFPRGFLGYSLPTEELPHRFVWLHDLTLPEATPAEEPETAEEDRRLRSEQSDALRSRGIERVWVSPQIPLVVFLALGVGLALLVGNILLNLAALL